VPELPEVEVLVRQLDSLLRGRKVYNVRVRRRRVLGKTPSTKLASALKRATFTGVTRRGKFLLFDFVPPGGQTPSILLGHLGMTGRMFLSPRNRPLPKHAAVVLDLGRENFIFEDTRYFGKFTLDTTPLTRLGPEPLDKAFTFKHLAERLHKSSQPIKVKLLDQSLVAGIGNIYASEALFRAGISPLTPARQLTTEQTKRLLAAIRQVLSRAIRFGSTVPLNYTGAGRKDALFYFGTAPDTSEFYDERLRVYDREGRPCSKCGTVVQRMFQAGRSTFFCAHCQST